jgi:hypothetical protein
VKKRLVCSFSSQENAEKSQNIKNYTNTAHHDKLHWPVCGVTYTQLLFLVKRAKNWVASKVCKFYHNPSFHICKGQTFSLKKPLVANLNPKSSLRNGDFY